MKPISVLLVDDNPTFLQVASRFLQEYHELAIVGTASDGAEALSQIRQLQPHVILLDINMPNRSGLEVIPDLRHTLPGVGIIVLTLLDTNGYEKAALAAGADAFVSKTRLVTDLLPAIRRVAQTNGRVRRKANNQSMLGK